VSCGVPRARFLLFISPRAKATREAEEGSREDASFEQKMLLERRDSIERRDSFGRSPGIERKESLRDQSRGKLRRSDSGRRSLERKASLGQPPSEGGGDGGGGKRASFNEASRLGSFSERNEAVKFEPMSPMSPGSAKG